MIFRSAGWHAIVSAVILLMQPVSSFGQPGTNSSSELFDDAALNDVTFVNADLGWAVGDQGTILRTEDGGKTWLAQSLPVPARLESVSFVDARNGWCAGGIVHPYTLHTSAVLFRTQDGGRIWSQLNTPLMPGLKQLQFRDLRQGWAAGSASPMFPTGVFQTMDGGRSWSPCTGPRTSGWLVLESFDDANALVLGHGGDHAWINRRELRRPDGVSELPPYCFRGAADLGALGVLAVGDAGTVLRSADRGRTWHSIAAAVPRAAADFDFHAIARHENHCWIAGSPGSLVLHSSDGGTSWESAKTGQSLPIRRLRFLDASHGWGVGSLGTVIATTDGGRSWTTLRGEGRHLALLGLYSGEDGVPFELFAELCGNQGYRGYVQLLNRRDLDSPDIEETSVEDRASAATVRAGAGGVAIAPRFPLRQRVLGISKENSVEGWSQVWGRPGLDALDESIVKYVRQWRPEIVLMEDFTARDADSEAKWLGPLLVAAIQKAAHAEQYPAQISEQGLHAWKVQKIVVGRAGQGKGTIVLNTSQVAARLGRSLTNIGSACRALITSQIDVGPASLEFHLLVDHLPAEVGRRDFFAGLPLASGGPARRLLSTVPAQELAELNQIAQRQRNVQKLIAYAAGSEQSTAWLAQLGDLTKGLDQDAIGDALFPLALRFHAAGRSDLALEVLQVMGERVPRHELASAALWLRLLLDSSAELDARRPVAGRDGSATRRKRLDLITEQLRQTAPQLAARSSTRLIVAANDRMADRLREAELQYRSVLALEPETAGRAAETELILLGNRRTALPAHMPCRRVTVRPRLDGQLDDESWQGLSPTALRSPQYDDEAWPAEITLAHDDEFLYLTATCVKATKGTYTKSDAARPRDPDLSNNDRLELFIDVDRDYATWYDLTVDHRGWTAESCAGDPTWNPEWYVAAVETSDSWTIEAAIAKRDLASVVGQGPPVWAFGVKRIVPGVGLQSWTQPAAAQQQFEALGILTLE